MKNFKRIALVSIVSFLGFSALSATIFGAVGQSDILSSSHTQEMECERDMQDKLLEEQKLLKQLEAINMDLEALRTCRDTAVQERVDWMNTAEAADFEYTFGEKLEEYTETMPEDVFVFDNLAGSINKYWSGSILEGKGDLLVNECKRSTVPDLCVKVIAAQTKYETSFGTTGTGRPPKRNLTGIRDSGVWRTYEKYDDSLKDTVKLFIDGNYQDYFTIYGFQDGLERHLARWGTNHYPEVLNDVSKL